MIPLSDYRSLPIFNIFDGCLARKGSKECSFNVLLESDIECPYSPLRYHQRTSQRGAPQRPREILAGLHMKIRSFQTKKAKRMQHDAKRQ